MISTSSLFERESKNFKVEELGKLPKKETKREHGRMAYRIKKLPGGKRLVLKLRKDTGPRGGKTVATALLKPK